MSVLDPGLRLFVEDTPGERRLALTDDTESLLELVVQREGPARAPEAGDIHLGKVTRLERSLAAAFLDLGARAGGFLPLNSAPPGLSEGARLPVKVVRAPSGTKGAKLTAELSKRDRAALAERVPDPEGAPLGLLIPAVDQLDRLLALGPAAVAVEGSGLFARLRGRQEAGDIDGGLRLSLHHAMAPLFSSAGLEEAVDAALAPRVPLPGGGSLIIEPGETLVAVDVDSGARGAGRSRDAEALAVNLEAVPQLARTLRLRALSGRILVDFLEMGRAPDRRRVEAALAEALADDPEPFKLFPFHRSGLLELTRRRSRPPLHEVVMEPIGELGRGWMRRPESRAFEALRAARRALAADPGRPLELSLAPALLAALESGPAASARAALEERLGRPLPLRGDGAPADYALRRL